MDKPKKKIITAFILMVLAAAAVVAIYYFISNKAEDKTQDTDTGAGAGTGTEIEKLIAKDLDTKYPETPSEVVKLYWRFNKCMYNTDMEDKDFEQLLEQLRKLYDEEFLAKEENSWETMLDNFKKDRDEYRKNNKTITMCIIEPSSSAVYGETNGKESVSIQSSTVIKQKAKRIKLNERFICRRDEDENWKILGWEQVPGDS